MYRSVRPLGEEWVGARSAMVRCSFAASTACIETTPLFSKYGRRGAVCRSDLPGAGMLGGMDVDHAPGSARCLTGPAERFDELTGTTGSVGEQHITVRLPGRVAHRRAMPMMSVGECG